MTIGCKFCVQLVSSLIIDNDLAFQDLTKRVLKHFQSKHSSELKETQQKIQQCSLAYLKYLSMTLAVAVPEDEKWLIEEVTKAQDIVMASLGFEAAEREELKEVQTEERKMV